MKSLFILLLLVAASAFAEHTVDEPAALVWWKCKQVLCCQLSDKTKTHRLKYCNSPDENPTDYLPKTGLGCGEGGYTRATSCEVTQEACTKKGDVFYEEN